DTPQPAIEIKTESSTNGRRKARNFAIDATPPPNKKPYTGPHPLCNTCKYHHPTQVPCRQCTNCQRKSHIYVKPKFQDVLKRKKTLRVSRLNRRRSHVSAGEDNCGSQNQVKKGGKRKVKAAAQPQASRKLRSTVYSLSIFWYLKSQTLENRKEILKNMCDVRAIMLQDQFNVSMNHVQAMSILISTINHGKFSSASDQVMFAKYTERTAFERPLTSGVAYAARVLHSEREQFEKQQGWTIKKMTSVNKDKYNPEDLEPSPIQPEYAPVIFAQDTVAHVISLDMLTKKEGRENVLRARALGKGVLTAPLSLIKSNRLGVILTFAVYKRDLPSNATPEERIEATGGYLGGVFDIESLVEKLLQQLASKQTINVNVYDTTNISDPISMYGTDAFDTGLEHVSPLNFGDPSRKHEMRCRFKQKQPCQILAISTSFGIFVIILLIAHILHETVNRTGKVEDDFHIMSQLKIRAEAADVAKSKFLATVSHEIRTPMNGVLGMLDMLMDTVLDVTQQDYGSGKALVSLTKGVLDQAKFESGKLELQAVRFDLWEIFDDVLALFSGKSQEKGIELAVYISAKVPEKLIGDPGRFRQIITNLMGNSIEDLYAFEN
ncbi:hypothetical protein M8C21_006737, partial [Ambrosia artemisiifolia]